MSSPDPPLVSFVLLAYNQERFIRDAVEGAFAQTYAPLEIILSDDCSADRTFEIMSEMAAAYNGPHRILLNRNLKNCGIGGHVNKVNSIAKGQLVVAAAGDDISVADRVQKVVLKWSEDPEKIHLVYSGCKKINIDGSFRSLNISHREWDLEESFVRSDDSILGAVCAWSRACVDKFGPLLEGLHHEDSIFPFRALLLGQIAFVPEPLVDYRVLAGSTVQNLGPKLSFNSVWRLRHDLNSNIGYVWRELNSKSVIIEQKRRDLLLIGGRPELVNVLAARANDVANQLFILSRCGLSKKLQTMARLGLLKPRFIKLLVKSQMAQGVGLRLESREAL